LKEEGDKGGLNGNRGEAEHSRVGLEETARRLSRLIYKEEEDYDRDKKVDDDDKGEVGSKGGSVQQIYQFVPQFRGENKVDKPNILRPRSMPIRLLRKCLLLAVPRYSSN
jgi:hypothetical protein